jgi:hypothetical protein
VKSGHQRGLAEFQHCFRAQFALTFDGLLILAMDVTASDHPAGSCINRQPQEIAPPACFARDDPVSAASVDVPDALDAIASCDSYCILSINATSAVNSNAVAINRNALRNCAGNDGRNQLSQTED